MPTKRRAPTKEEQLRIWMRDGWYCCLSGAPIIFPPTLKLLDIMWPNHGYWDLRYRYSHAPLLAVLAGVVDHCEPSSRGGSSDPSNLQAACNAWNISKGNRREFEARFSFWREKPKSDTWDGLYTVFRRLYDPNVHGGNNFLASWHKAALHVEAEADRGGTS